MTDFEEKKRDPFLVENVYREQIEYWPESNFFKKSVTDKINDLGVDKNHRARLSNSRAHDILEYLILSYSSGGDLTDLSPVCKNMLEEFLRHQAMFPEWSMKYWEADAYQYFMWLLSLAYLFDLKEYIPKIASWYQPNPNGGEDPLISALFAHFGCAAFSEAQEGMVFETTYRPLLLALQSGGDKAAAQKHLATYLKNWYKGMKGCYWYNRHKGKFATHFGYWSFEAGLVTVLCDLDDSEYREMQFYPKDLVDYARSQQVKAELAAGAPSRVAARQACLRSGYWYTPAKQNSRTQFKQGDVMPDFPDSSYGATIWYWDQNQD